MAEALEGRHDLWSYDRRGHGRSADTDDPIGFDAMLVEAAAVVEDVVGSPVHLVGHSDGASLALTLAIARPELVASVSAFSANTDPSGMAPTDLTPDELAAALVEVVADGYAELSPDDPARLPATVSKVVRMWFAEPTITRDELGAIRCPVLIAAAERDTITAEHTRALHAAIPGARLVFVPRTTHMLVEQDPAACAALVEETVARAVGRVSPDA